MAEEKKKRPPVDWEKMEPEWVAGIKTKLQLSEEYKVSRAAIDNHFKALGIERDETAKIRAKAEALVTQDAVTQKVTVTPEERDKRKERLELNAEMLAGVMRGHRKDAGRLRKVVNALLEKVENIVQEVDLFKQVGELCAKDGDSSTARINDLYNKVISLPSQTDTTKKLAETMKILIDLERRIFKIEDGSEDPAEAAARGAAEGATRAMGEFGKSEIKALKDELENAQASA